MTPDTQLPEIAALWLRIKHAERGFERTTGRLEHEVGRLHVRLEDLEAAHERAMSLVYDLEHRLNTLDPTEGPNA